MDWALPRYRVQRKSSDREVCVFQLCNGNAAIRAHSATEMPVPGAIRRPFNTQRYLEFEERDPTGPAPVLINYCRNVASNFSTGVAIRCYDANGRVLRRAEAEYEGRQAVDALVEKTCGG